MQKSSLSHHICLIVTGIFLSFSANAAMYKWVDEQGNTHYTQSPPPDGIQGDTIKPPSEVDVDSAQKDLERQSEKADSYLEERKKQAEELAKEEAEKERLKKNCEISRSNEASLSRPRVNLEDEEGNVYSAPEEERLAKLKIARENVAKFCN